MPLSFIRIVDKHQASHPTAERLQQITSNILIPIQYASYASEMGAVRTSCRDGNRPHQHAHRKLRKMKAKHISIDVEYAEKQREWEVTYEAVDISSGGKGLREVDERDDLPASKDQAVEEQAVAPSCA